MHAGGTAEKVSLVAHAHPSPCAGGVIYEVVDASSGRYVDGESAPGESVFLKIGADFRELDMQARLGQSREAAEGPLGQISEISTYRQGVPICSHP